VRIISPSEFLTTGVWHNADSAALIAVAWLGAHAVAVVDDRDRMTIVDPFELRPLQVCDCD
jgi:hypothetical protein